MTTHGKAAKKRDAMKRVEAVQEILRRWDPIGIDPGNLAPADEYDSYARTSCRWFPKAARSKS